MNPQLQRASLLIQQSRHELAETALREVLVADPEEAHAHALLALCLSARKSFPEATEAAQKAIHLAPDCSFAHYVASHVLLQRNRIPEALASVEEALRLDPFDPDFFALLGQIHLTDRRWKEAEDAAQKGLAIEPEHVECANLRAIALIKQGRKAEASATIDVALAKNPENSLTHANQGWAYLEKGEPEKALHHFREALRLDAENEWARQGIVEALKARHFIYGLMLKWFLFMAKLSPNVQWGIILAGYFGNRLLGEVAKSNPALAPYILPIRILYLAFVILTWTADPLFNLVLRTNRFGRMALSRQQIIESNFVGGSILLALVLLGCALVVGFNGFFGLGALVFAMLVIPISGTFKVQEGWPKWTMGILCSVIALAGLIGLALGLMNRAGNLVLVLMVIALIGSIASGWIVNLLGSVRVRK